MGIDYNALLYEDLSEIISAVSEFESFMTTLEARRLSMVASFDDNDIEELVGPINQVFSQFQVQLNQMIQQLTNLATQRLQHRDSIIEQLPGITTSTGTTEILLAMIADMIKNSEMVDSSVVTVGSVTADTTNTTVGTVLVTKVLPGNEPPGGRFQENRFTGGVDSQLSLDDTITVLCTSESPGSPGRELFQVVGLLPQQQYPFEQNQGGNIGSIRVSPDASAYVTGFDDFTANIPDDWTVQSGVAGTDFGEDTVNVLFNSSASLFLDNSSELRLDIYNQLDPGDSTLVYFRALREAGATGNVIVNLVVAGVSLASLTVNVATIGTANWTLHYFEIPIPADIGEDDGTSYLSIQASTLSDKVYIDSFNWMPFSWYAGVGIAVVMGEEPFLVDDRFTFTLTNDDASSLQRFFGRVYGVQLPVAAGETLGSELINNGSFTTDATGWTLSNASWAGTPDGHLAAPDDDLLSWTMTHNTVSFSSGTQYRVTLDVEYILGTINLQFNGVTTQSITTTGSKTYDLFPAGTGLFRVQGGAGSWAKIDNVSIKEIL